MGSFNSTGLLQVAPFPMTYQLYVCSSAFVLFKIPEQLTHTHKHTLTHTQSIIWPNDVQHMIRLL
jgi:hypothetical protein